MSPRKAHYRVPQYIAQAIRDKRKQLLYGPYDCPKCMAKKVAITIDKRAKEVKAACSSCDFKFDLKYRESLEPVDYYSKMLDQVREKRR